MRKRHALTSALVGLIIYFGATNLAVASPDISAPSQSSAVDNVTGKKIHYGNAYIGLSAGVIIPHKTTLSLSTDQDPKVSIQSEYKPGAALETQIGYNFNPYVAGEFALGYSAFGLKKRTIDGVKINDKHTFHNFTGLTHILFKPMGDYGIETSSGTFRASLFGGFGGGFMVMANSDKFSGNDAHGDVTLENKAKSSGVADLVAGLEMVMFDHLSVGLRYQFLFVNQMSEIQLHLPANESFTLKGSNLLAHVAGLQVTYQI